MRILAIFFLMFSCVSWSGDAPQKKPIKNQEASSKEQIVIYWRATPLSVNRDLLNLPEGEFVVLRDAKSGRPLQTWSHWGYYPITFSPDGKLALTTDNKQIILADTQTGETLQIYKNGDIVSRLYFSPDGKQTLTIYLKEILGTKTEWTAVLRDTHSAKILRTWKHVGYGIEAKFSPDGKNILMLMKNNRWDEYSSNQDIVILREVHSGSPIYTWKYDVIRNVEFSPNGRQILLNGHRYQSKNLARGLAVLKDVKSGKTIQTWEHGDSVASAAFSLDSKKVLTASVMGTRETSLSPDHLPYTLGISEIMLKDVRSGKTIKKWKQDGWISDLGFSPDGNRVVIAGIETQTVLRDINTGKTVEIWEEPFQHTYFAIFSFSSDGRQLLTGNVYGGSGNAVLTDVRSGQTLKIWKNGQSVDPSPSDLDFKSAVLKELSAIETEYRSLPTQFLERRSELESKIPTKDEFETIAEFEQRLKRRDAEEKSLSSNIQAYYEKLEPLPIEKRAHAFENALLRTYGNPELHDVRYDPEIERFFATLKASLDPEFKRLVSIAVPRDQARAAKGKLTSAENGLEVELRATDQNELIWGQPRVRLDDREILVDYVD